MKTIP